MSRYSQALSLTVKHYPLLLAKESQLAISYATLFAAAGWDEEQIVTFMQSVSDELDAAFDRGVVGAQMGM